MSIECEGATVSRTGEFILVKRLWLSHTIVVRFVYPITTVKANDRSRGFARGPLLFVQEIPRKDTPFKDHPVKGFHDYYCVPAEATVKKYAIDKVARRVHGHICRFTREQARVAGLDSYLVVIINNWANTVLSWNTAASADGRKSGQPMANGNNPSPGSDHAGVTAFLNSLVKLDPSLHAGAVQNMKFGKEWFGLLRPKFEALLRTYFARGGTQAMITVVSRDDLESAMREPEKWGHLMVRVRGFSIQFTETSPRCATGSAGPDIALRQTMKAPPRIIASSRAPFSLHTTGGADPLRRGAHPAI